MSMRPRPKPATLTFVATFWLLLSTTRASGAPHEQALSVPLPETSAERLTGSGPQELNATTQPLPTVWYRTSEGCPNGEQFVLRVKTYQQGVRLAEAGDRVDFVVTLTKPPEAQATGRLERQTDGGTIAISEVRDTDCDAVATALALGLSLSLTPATTPSSPATGSSTPGAASTVSLTVSPAAPPSSPLQATAAPIARAATVIDSSGGASGPPVSSTRDRDGSPDRSPETFTGAGPARTAHWSFGLHGEGAFVLNPSPLWGGEAFIEHRGKKGGWGQSSARAGVAVHHGREATAVGDVQQWLVAFRGSGCPLSWSLGPLSVAPCAEMDLGAVTAAGTSAFGERATALWATAAAAGRWVIPIAEHLALTGQVAVRVALNPYSMRGGGELLFESRPISPWAALGVLFPL